VVPVVGCAVVCCRVVPCKILLNAPWVFLLNSLFAIGVITPDLV